MRVGLKRTNDTDMGYFDVHPAKMYEAMTALSPASVINSTTPYYGPLLYSIGRAMGAHNVLEIGVAQFWTGGFLAWAVKENNQRYGNTGKYIGIDIQDKTEFQGYADELELPVEFMIDPEGSVALLERLQLGEKPFWPEHHFNLIYIDGYHNNDYLQQEVELLYPTLYDNGDGYLIIHDVYSYVEGAYPLILNNPKYKWEAIRFLPNYGLAILRKMDNYDHDKIHWPEGDQHLEEFPV